MRRKPHEKPGLPTTYKGPKFDETGRQYFLHEPSGCRYYVREREPDIEKLREQSRIEAAERASAPVPMRSTVQPEKRKRSSDRTASLFESYGRRDVDRPLAAAEWIEGSEPG
jgi:hypothetical protein